MLKSFIESSFLRLPKTFPTMCSDMVAKSWPSMGLLSYILILDFHPQAFLQQLEIPNEVLSILKDKCTMKCTWLTFTSRGQWSNTCAMWLGWGVPSVMPCCKIWIGFLSRYKCAGFFYNDLLFLIWTHSQIKCLIRSLIKWLLKQKK